MKIEIFVVITELKGDNKLIECLKLYDLKKQLIELFNGLTEFKESKGYWLNDDKVVITDNVKLWLIYTDIDNYLHNKTKFQNIIKEIKELTKQKTQAVAIDNDMKFI